MPDAMILFLFVPVPAKPSRVKIAWSSSTGGLYMKGLARVAHMSDTAEWRKGRSLLVLGIQWW